ncbi:RNA polymerase sigma factor [Lacimicrobium alkaliphilum]|uniref:RNA polymerase subunit sigma n=1 Tax=Lacimicrobium alkaliphilum TaxID=1526571 RepID=A0A0U2PH93_9ALTE|nr:RNA polymerase sigma factor [Lacimicrobium alkaliphilum]ALS98893.1 RNA polymerase subunit sigma [Lacimicrobium alkaliphilum]
MKHSNRAIIANLAEKHGRQVFQTAYRLLGDSHLAEDVTQEVFLKLFKKSPAAFDKIQNWPAYLCTMATSAAIDQLRRIKRRSEQPIEQACAESDSASGPCSTLAQQQDLERFRRTLTRLSPRDAQVFCLRHIEGLSYQEIAHCVDISTSLAGVSLHRAQQKLSQWLGESQLSGAEHELTY